GQAHPGRVREVRHHVTRPRAQPRLPGLADLRGQVVQVDAGRTAAHRPDGHVDQPGGPGDADVDGRDREQDVPFVAAQRPQGDEHRLLAADGDHDRLRVDQHLLVAGELPGDQLMDDSFGPAVLKEDLIYLRIITSLFIPQVTHESFEILLDQRGVKETFVRASGSERYRLRIA